MKGNIMSKLKNYIMDIEDQVFALDLEEIITEADTVEIAQQDVISQLGSTLKNAFDISIAKTIVEDSWNDLWGDYV
jgi:hypothetical protein